MKEGVILKTLSLGPPQKIYNVRYRRLLSFTKKLVILTAICNPFLLQSSHNLLPQILCFLLDLKPDR